MFKDIIVAIQNRETLTLGAVAITLDEVTNTSTVTVYGRIVALVNPLNLKVTWKNVGSTLAQGVIKALINDRMPAHVSIAFDDQTVTVGYRGKTVEYALDSWVTFS